MYQNTFVIGALSASHRDVRCSRAEQRPRGRDMLNKQYEQHGSDTTQGSVWVDRLRKLELCSHRERQDGWLLESGWLVAFS